MNIWIGNLSFDLTDEDLRQAFEEYGDVESAKIIINKHTGRSRGFGFVEMPDEAEAKSAIEGLNEKELKGRSMIVNESTSRPGERNKKSDPDD